jgi:hypothetical protein
MTKQVRWKCEICNHGLLAPTKPRKNDVRRYCLPCSGKTGKLVERISPTLEKQRTVKSEQRKVKVKKVNTEKKVLRDKKSVVLKRNAAIRKEGERVWKLMEGWHKGKPMPKINIVQSRYKHGAGHAKYWRNEIQVNVYPEQNERSSQWTWYVLAHELAHCACPPVVTNGKRDVHHKEFYKALKHACEKRWKVSVSFADVRGEQYGYAVDDLIEAQVLKDVQFRIASIR